MLNRILSKIFCFPLFLLCCFYHHSARRSEPASEVHACVTWLFFFFINLVSLLLCLELVDVLTVPWHYFKWFGRNLETYIGAGVVCVSIAYAMSSLGAVEVVLKKETEGVYKILGFRPLHAVVYAISSILVAFFFVFLHREYR